VGRLVYGPNSSQFEFDDRLLAHMRVVMVMKLRRRESFTLSWDEGAARGGGRVCLWIDSSIPLEFHFLGGREPALNRAWIDALASVAASSVGLVPLPEPAAVNPASNPEG
jgi:hypothetical protein